MLSPGDRLGHYVVVSPVGVGGMGEVYKARDTRLDRIVALKVLSPRARTDEDGRLRFAQEARAVSALNHPNIVTIYEIGYEDDIDYFAMEFISGETLHRKINGKPLPVVQVLRYASQIADALAAAHALNIVHRDLKPANIMITERDEVKLLDFGLAKLGERHLSDADATLSIHANAHTMTGVLIGTAAYMSPEQVEEKQVGPQADVFAFGVLLYEMVTGVRPFQGGSKVATMSAILHYEPPAVQEKAPDAPVELEHLVRLCLQKDPEKRPHQMSEVRTALEGIQIFFNSGIWSGSKWQPLPRPPRRKWQWIAGAAALLLIAAAWIGGTLRGPAKSVHTEKVMTRLTADTGFSGFPSLSPDGKFLAFASDRSGEGHLDIWVQQAEAGADPIRLTKGDVDASEPAFSPDALNVAYRSEREGGGIYTVRSLGGQPRLIAPLGRRPRYSPDGKWILYWEGQTGTGFVPGSARVRIVAADGGSTPRDLVPGFALSAYPIWSADGTRVLFLGRRDPTVQPPDIDWWIVPAAGGDPVATGALALLRDRRLTPVPGEPVLIPGVYSGDQVLFGAKSGDSINVWEVSIPPAAGRVSGDPRRRTSGTNIEIQPATAGPVTLFSSVALTANIWSAPFANSSTGALQAITHGVTVDAFPSLSWDGRRMAFISGRSGKPNVWLLDRKSDKEIPLTSGAAPEAQPKISGDGSTVAYVEDQPRPRKLFTVALGADGKPGTPQRICEDCGVPTDVSRDGSLLLMEDPVVQSPMLLNPRTGTKHPLTTVPERWHAYAAHFSHDGKWASFHADLGSSPFFRQILIVKLRDDDQTIPMQDWITVTDGKNMDREAYWSPTDDTLYFLSEREGFRCIWAQRLDPATKRPRGPALPVQHFHRVSRSLSNIPGTVAAVGLTAIPGQLIFGLGEVSGNIWMQKDEAR